MNGIKFTFFGILILNASLLQDHFISLHFKVIKLDLEESCI